MPAAVIPFQSARSGNAQRGSWSLLELALPGEPPRPFGILLVDEASDGLEIRLRDATEFEDLDEAETDILTCLRDDLLAKSAERGAKALQDGFEDTLSHFLRIADRIAIEYSGDASRAADRLFREHVCESQPGEDVVQPFVTHLPLYAIRAAATKFGEEVTGEEEGWVPAPPRLRLTPDMFVARVVGRSMEPLIPDGSLCVFRRNVTGTRQGKRLLIEQFGATGDGNRYTIKQYSSVRRQLDEDSFEHERILLKPLNREFEAFELGPNQFQVIAEFVTVLDTASE